MYNSSRTKGKSRVERKIRAQRPKVDLEEGAEDEHEYQLEQRDEAALLIAVARLVGADRRRWVDSPLEADTKFDNCGSAHYVLPGRVPDQWTSRIHWTRASGSPGLRGKLDANPARF